MNRLHDDGSRPASVGPAAPDVRLLSVTQATPATFADLYFERALLFFIQMGSKRVLCPVSGEMIGEAGDVMIFPPGSLVTMENRPLLNQAYRADGLSIPDDLVEAVFSDRPPPDGRIGVQILRETVHRPAVVLGLIRQTLQDETLPPSIRRHRLQEPLVWLRDAGIRLSVRTDEHPLGRLRRLIETDPGRPWRLPDAAAHFAMSEATFRRWLARSGLGFSKVLSSTRLERGLSLLQTTSDPVSQIALDCGFRTPSHFTEAFRERFGITPRQIRSTRE